MSATSAAVEDERHGHHGKTGPALHARRNRDGSSAWHPSASRQRRRLLLWAVLDAQEPEPAQGNPSTFQASYAIVSPYGPATVHVNERSGTPPT